MHIHQLAPPIDLVPQRSETVRPPGAFDPLSPLAVRQRSPKERKQSRGERPQLPNAPGTATAAPNAETSIASPHQGSVDIIV